MPYSPVRKAALLIPSGSPQNPEAKHLYVILTDACADGFHLLGSVTSVHRGIFHDKTCIIQAGGHPFITHDSYFEYRRLRTVRGNHIETCVNGWVYSPKDPVTDALFDRICVGINISEFTPRGMREYWEENEP